MAVGFEVSKGLIDVRSGEAGRALLRAFELARTLKVWLDDHPGFDAQAVLVAEFGYTEDEAYLLHSVFTELNDLRTTNQGTFSKLRKLTGLE